MFDLRWRGSVECLPDVEKLGLSDEVCILYIYDDFIAEIGVDTAKRGPSIFWQLAVYLHLPTFSPPKNRALDTLLPSSTSTASQPPTFHDYIP